jgi:hypothetical protein
MNYKIATLGLFVILTSFSSQLNAQIGGTKTWMFLDLPVSSRQAALGGNNASISDNDPTLTYSNPSLLNPQLKNNLTLNYTGYFSGVKYAFADYIRPISKLGTFSAYIQYFNYGDFTRTDATGQELGTFRAADYAVGLGWGRQLDSNFSIGANFKTVVSSYDEWSSTGFAMDIAGTWASRDKLTSASLIARNIGRQLDYYTDGNNESLPFEMQFALSRKLPHAPFRLTLLLTHLEKWDLTYYDPNDPDNQPDPITGEKKSKSDIADFADKAMRHVVVGAEFAPSQSFMVRVGYNYQRRQEMKEESAKGTVGFSWGFGIRISKFYLSYARTTYHQTGSPNYITLTTNISNWM